jgi:plastocyanin
MIRRPVMRSGRPLLAATMLGCAVMAILAIMPARADDAVTLSLEIKDHRFDPAELHAPPGKPITLRVKNAGSNASEIESNEMHFEKVIAAGAEATIRVRPLKPGRYSFFDDFHRQTEGFLIVP